MRWEKCLLLFWAIAPTLKGNASRSDSIFERSLRKCCMCFLDCALRESVGWPVMDSTIFAEDLACLKWAIPHVLIDENKAVFLCLPERPIPWPFWVAGRQRPCVAPARGWMNRRSCIGETATRQALGSCPSCEAGSLRCEVSSWISQRGSDGIALSFQGREILVLDSSI